MHVLLANEPSPSPALLRMRKYATSENDSLNLAVLHSLTTRFLDTPVHLS
jgi:hypothetical protein